MNITEMLDSHQRISNKNIHIHLRGEIEQVLSSLKKIRLSMAENSQELSLISEIEKAEVILDRVNAKLEK
jgi:hypothetical protein